MQTAGPTDAPCPPQAARRMPPQPRARRPPPKRTAPPTIPANTNRVSNLCKRTSGRAARTPASATRSTDSDAHLKSLKDVQTLSGLSRAGRHTSGAWQRRASAAKPHGSSGATALPSCATVQASSSHSAQRSPVLPANFCRPASMKMAQNQTRRMSTPRASGSEVDAVCATMRSPAKPAAEDARALRRQQLTDRACALNRAHPGAARRRTARGAYRAATSQARMRVTARAICAWLSAAKPPAAPALAAPYAPALICAARARRLCAPMRRTRLGGAGTLCAVVPATYVRSVPPDLRTVPPD